MKQFKNLGDVKGVPAIPGQIRKTLAGNSELMMCLFEAKAGTHVEMHDHPAAQIGYVIEGDMEFFDKDGVGHRGGAGFSYVFHSNEKHGCIAHQDSRFIECFAPSRSEYDD